MVRLGQITRSSSGENTRRPVSLYSIPEQPDANVGFSLEKRTIFVSADGRKDAAIPAILRSNRAPCFGVQLAFLDSDGGFDLLLPDLAPIAPGNFGVRYLEHVTHSLS